MIVQRPAVEVAALPSVRVFETEPGPGSPVKSCGFGPPKVAVIPVAPVDGGVILTVYAIVASPEETPPANCHVA